MNIFVYFLNEKLPGWTKSYGTVPKYKTLHKSGHTNTNILKIYLSLPMYKYKKSSYNKNCNFLSY